MADRKRSIVAWCTFCPFASVMQKNVRLIAKKPMALKTGSIILSAENGSWFTSL